MKIVYLALGLWLLPGMLWAQSAEKENEFTMSMQIRPRAEYRNGAQFPRFEGDKAAAFINNRARLSMEYKRSDLSMKISAQHVGVWGQDPQIDTNGRFIMNEAWAKLDFGAGFFAQLGRQTLSYDDERILGGLDWNVAGRYHDALKLGYAKNAHQLHFILAFNQNKARMPTNCISFLPSTKTRKSQKEVPIIMTARNLTRICRPFGIIMRRKLPILMSLYCS